MASLAKTAVSGYPTAIGSNEFFFGGMSGRAFVVKRLKLVLTGQGGATNTIPAAALGFTKLADCGNLFDATNAKVYKAAVDPVNNIIVLSAVAGDTLVDVTTTAAYINVTGN